MLKCFSLDEFLQLSFHYTFYRLYSCYHVLYIIANTVINMTTIAFDIVLISFIIIWQLLYGYQGSSKTREVGFDIKGSSVVIIFFNAMITQQPFFSFTDMAQRQGTHLRRIWNILPRNLAQAQTWLPKQLRRLTNQVFLDTVIGMWLNLTL